MLQLLPFIETCSDTVFSKIPQAIRREKANLASRKLQECLLALERRMRALEMNHYELINSALMVGATRSLRDVQLDFVDRLEAFHQQVYATLSCFGYFLQFFLHPNGPSSPQLNSVKQLIKFFESLVSEEVKHDLLPALEKSRFFRSCHVDHPHQEGGMYDFGTATHGGRAVAFFFTVKPSSIESGQQENNMEIHDELTSSDDSKKHEEGSYQDHGGFVTYDPEVLRRTYPWIDDCYIPPHHREVFLAVRAVVGNILDEQMAKVQ